MSDNPDDPLAKGGHDSQHRPDEEHKDKTLHQIIAERNGQPTGQGAGHEAHPGQHFIFPPTQVPYSSTVSSTTHAKPNSVARATLSASNRKSAAASTEPVVWQLIEAVVKRSEVPWEDPRFRASRDNLRNKIKMQTETTRRLRSDREFWKAAYEQLKRTTDDIPLQETQLKRDLKDLQTENQNLHADLAQSKKSVVDLNLMCQKAGVLIQQREEQQKEASTRYERQIAQIEQEKNDIESTVEKLQNALNRKEVEAESRKKEVQSLQGTHTAKNVKINNLEELLERSQLAQAHSSCTSRPASSVSRPLGPAAPARPAPSGPATPASSPPTGPAANGFYDHYSPLAVRPCVSTPRFPERPYSRDRSRSPVRSSSVAHPPQTYRDSRAGSARGLASEHIRRLICADCHRRGLEYSCDGQFPCHNCSRDRLPCGYQKCKDWMRGAPCVRKLCSLVHDEKGFPAPTTIFAHGKIAFPPKGPSRR